MMIDQLLKSSELGSFSYDNKYGGEVVQPLLTHLSVVQEKVLFLKPMEYMNKSGGAVQKVMNFYKIKTEELLVIHDDIDLPIGKIQFKFG
jgi:PTH1 family peptidyl-tRNA hydrolase